MQRHNRSKNYYEDLPQEVLENKLAQILWYAQSDVNRSWKSVGKNEKAAYRRVAQEFIKETKFRVNHTRRQISEEKWQAKQHGEIQVADPTGLLIDFEDLDEYKILGIKR